MKSLPLSKAVEAYFVEKVRDLAPQTRRNHRSVLGRYVKWCKGASLAASAGVSPNGVTYLEGFLAKLAETRTDGSMAQAIVIFRTFYTWAVQSGRIAVNPALRVKMPRQPRIVHPVLGVGELGTLLGAAKDPWERFLLTFGVYMGRRATEVRQVRISDVDMAAGTIKFMIAKKGTPYEKRKPIPAGLKASLREYLAWYAERAMEQFELPLQPSWYLIPRRRVISRFERRSGGRIHSTGEHSKIKLYPDLPAANMWNTVRRCLAETSFPLVDPVTGQKRRVGLHDLRRMAANSLYVVTDGDIRAVKALLEHATEAQTRAYLRTSEDDEHLSEVATSVDYLAVKGGNVTPLRRVR